MSSRTFRLSAYVVLAAAVAACGGVSDDQPGGEFTPPVVEYVVVFEDNFDGDSLDASKWNVESGDGCPELCGWGNNELQIYGSDNIDVSGGTLKIEGRREPDGSYTSARINTQGKFDFRYGRVEVGARLPAGQGIWPAIWMLHSDPTIYGPWPLSGEIDIMEAFNYGVNGNQFTQSTTHYGLPTPPFNGTSSRTELSVNGDINFHEYAIEWEKDKIRFFVDGVHFQTQNSDNWFTYYPADEDGLYDELGPYTLGLEDAPFDQAFHLIINFAIGGNPVGDPDGSTVFPQTLEIDYVRVYECANSNPSTGRGCGTADASVVPLEDNDGGPLENAVTEQPYIEMVDLYLDGPETINVTIGQDTASNTLGVNGFTGANATVTSDPAFPDPDDPANTVWHVAVANDVANVFLESQDLSDDPILNTGFNFSGGGLGGDPVGEVVFDMQVNSITAGTRLLVKLDSGFPNLGEVEIPDSELAIGSWKTYSIKFGDLLASPGGSCCGGTGVDLANVLNPFVFEVVDGDADVYLDNIRVTNACYVVGACKAAPRTRGIPDFVVFDDAVNVATWDVGIAGADSGSGFANYTDGTNPANKANWAIVTDTDPARGEVIDVTFNDSTAFGVWFIQSTGAVDMNAYAAGAVVFDLIVDDYGNNTDGMTMKIDCFFPCTSGDKNLGVVADGVWETISVPVSSLTSTGLDLSSVNTGLVLFPTSQSGTIRYRVDNVRWVAEADAPPLAQIDLPVTFEDPGTDYTVTDFGDPVAASTNPAATDPVDAGNTVAATTKPAGAPLWAGTVIGTSAGFANPIPFTATDTLMSVRVYSPAAGIPVLLKVENDDASVFAEVMATTTAADTWETLVFDFSTVGIDVSATYVRAIIFFDFGTDGNDATYFWDDVAFGDGSSVGTPVDLPVTFDDANVDYEIADFGNVGTSLVADPDNMANMVASTNKPPGAELWGGTVIAATSGFANPIPFSATETSLQVRVWSPDAGIPVRLKVENAANGAISVETETLTTMAGAWEVMEFDFSNEVSGTPALDLSQAYEKVVIFFNFGTDGNTAGDKTYLWDDVSFVSAPALAQVDLPITFDDSGTDYDVVAFGNASASVPVADPENPSNSVAQFDKPPGAELWAGATMGATNGLANPIPFTASDTLMSVRTWSPDAGIPVRLKVENAANSAISVETEAMTTVAGGWETLVFDFANEVSGTPALDPSQAYEKVVIFFNFGTDGNTAGDKTYYWEDVRFGVPLDLPVTFDNPAIDYAFVDFGDPVAAATTLATDPVDGTNQVAATTKPSGAPVWAGTVIGDGSGFANPIPFTPGNTLMSLRINSPAAGIPVLLKVENADASVTAEVTATTVSANAWETLVFDFSTVSIDTSAVYVRAVVFFDFGQAGNDATYLWDSVSFGGTP